MNSMRRIAVESVSLVILGFLANFAIGAPPATELAPEAEIVVEETVPFKFNIKTPTANNSVPLRYRKNWTDRQFNGITVYTVPLTRGK